MTQSFGMSDGALFHDNVNTPVLLGNANASINRHLGLGVMPGLENQTSILPHTVESNAVGPSNARPMM